MFNFNDLDLNFDFDGDGILDSHADFVDSDGNGIADQAIVDLDGDGQADAILSDTNNDGIVDEVMYDSDADEIDMLTPEDSYEEVDDTDMYGTDADGMDDTPLFDLDGDGIEESYGYDSNGDGKIDSFETALDTDDDGNIDTLIVSNDYNQDGVIDSQTIYYDGNNDGTVDQVIKGFDSDVDGIIDDYTTYTDYDGDGHEDEVIREQFIDSDVDGEVDTYVVNYDYDGDGIVDEAEIYDFDPVTGAISLLAIDDDTLGNVAGLCSDDLENFDPSTADMDAVSGDPAASMREWEFQGNTGRCALYSQKFVIEELTGQELDIEELADLAEANGWFSEENGTALLNMDKVLDYYGINNEMSFHNDISDIDKCLNAGGKVIVAIDADEIWYGESDDLFTPGDGPNHAVEVIGIDYSNPDEPMVILNDSGNPNGCGEMVPLDVFEDAWEDGNCQMISCM